MKEKEIQAEKAKIASVVKKKKGAKSYYALSKESGLTAPQIHSIEKGEGYTVDSLLKLCDATGCKVQITEK